MPNREMPSSVGPHFAQPVMVHSENKLVLVILNMFLFIPPTTDGLYLFRIVNEVHLIVLLILCCGYVKT